ncbi:MAG: hypothetical protein ACRDZN_01375 [Acidimicrobiales bacterium]
MRQTARHHLVAAVLGVALVLSACGGDDDGSGATSDDAAGSETTVAGETTTTAAAAADAGASAGEGGVPDPCSLVPAANLVALLGADPGAGTPSAFDPDQRKICIYASGVILAVELGEHYEEAIDIIRDEMGVDAVQDVSGVGNAAAWHDVGEGAGQFLVSGDEYFVGVTVPAGGPDVGQAVAEAMLAALAAR